MEFIDTHSHLNFKVFQEDFDDVFARMQHQSLRSIVVGSQYSTSKRAVALAKAHPNELFAAVGLHPVHLFSMRVVEEGMPFVTRKEAFDRERYAELAKQSAVVAIGECGLDYHQFPEGESEHACKKMQWEVLRNHIHLARQFTKPCIIHCRASATDPRDAYRDLLALLKEEHFSHCVIHAFATHADMVEGFLEHGTRISFTGLITFPEYVQLLDAVRHTPLDRMMIETDAPYMSPVPKRHERCEPAFLPFIAQTVADVKKVTIEEVAHVTTTNAVEFFGLPKQSHQPDVH